MSTSSLSRLTSVVVIVAGLAAPHAALAQTAAVQATPQQIADWQKEMADAKKKRSVGRLVAFAGLGTTLAGGELISRPAMRCLDPVCSSEDRLAAGEAVQLGGLVMMSLGARRAHDGSVELN